MNRYERVIQILDEAVGGSDQAVNFHGAFWRGLTRDQFVARKVFGLPLVSVGHGADSTLIKSLKGETPFGADLGNPDADFNRMPSGRPPVQDQDIAFIQTWIDEGCLEDEVKPSPPMSWRRTNAPFASSRTDDIWFMDDLTGWGVNSDGNIIHTTDGGDTWVVQKSMPGVYLRCVGFANSTIGWVGTLSRARRLFNTTDGGNTWNQVTPLPAQAPVAVCGLSVVDDKTVYCSGTNRPEDIPRMMKTMDGGTTWTAWDMSPHASILIDCFFTDSLHGWVVGGKSDEPTPTTRSKLKPVVLETQDGGVTWVNRLAGQEANFPFGEWGWKIQFLDRNVGFVSLENFSAGAILKTTDGGNSWTRIVVNDPQGNVNLEGIGFVSEAVGWVGGWGPGGFGTGGVPRGFSSSTSDGGATWQDANDIGLFINRFRFLGNPLRVGYASGDTVYKYSAASPGPLHNLAAHNTALRELLPDSSISGQAGAASIRLNIPEETMRLSLVVWTRFGEEVGCILDEIRPTPGPMVFDWDTTNSRGEQLPAGDYILRIIVDDKTASSLLRLTSPQAARAAAVAPSKPATKLVEVMNRKPRIVSIAKFVEIEQADIDDLRDALQIAIQLELATLPPYLTARWTIVDESDPVADSIFEVRGEEMLHFGLACNMLAAIDGFPRLAEASVVPKYPGELPGGVRPGLRVTLQKLTREQVAVFMEIEYPQNGPIAFAETSPTTIGAFYHKILETFRALNPDFKTERQIERTFSFGRLFKIDSLDKVEQAIGIINLQGEGSNTSPEESGDDLAHYYRFGEIYHGRRLKKDDAGQWGYTGDMVPMPDVYNMHEIPDGGYQVADVPDMETWDLIERFDRAYSEMLRKLQDTWRHGTPASITDAVGYMRTMSDIGRELVAKPRPDGQGNYGPCFRYVE